MKAILDFPARRPRTTLLMALVLTLISTLLVTRLRPETSIQGLLDAKDPGVIALGRILQDFPVAGEMVLMVSLVEPDQGEQSLLDFATRFQDLAASDPEASATLASVSFRPSPQFRDFVEHVMVPNGLLYLDSSELADARHRLTPEGMAQQMQRNREMLSAPGPAAAGIASAILKDPLRLHEFLLGRMNRIAPTTGGLPAADSALLSPDRRAVLIRIAGRTPPSDLAFGKRIVSDVNRIAAAANTDHLHLDMAGAYAISAYSAGVIQKDAIEGVVFSAVGLFTLFLILFRRPWMWLVLALLPVSIGILWGFGAYSLFRTTITPLAAVVGGAFGGIGVDYFVFLLANNRRNESPDVLATLHRLRGPLSAAFMTSVIGFAVIAFSPIRLLRDFAILGSLALLGAFLAAISLLPALLSLLKPVTVARPLSWTGQIRSSIVRRRLTYPVLALLLVLLGLAITPFVHHGRAGGGTNPLQPQPNPPLEAQSRIGQKMGLASGSVQLLLNADSSEALIHLATELDHRLQTPAMATAGLRRWLGPGSFLPDPAAPSGQLNMSAADIELVIGNLRLALSQAGLNPDRFESYYTFLRRLLAPSTPPGLDQLVARPEVGQLVLSRSALAGGPANDALCTLFFEHTTDGTLDTLHQAIDGLPGITVAGSADVNRGLQAAVRRDLPRMFLAALGLITVYHLLHFRRVAPALLALVPTVISFAVLGSFVMAGGVELNLVNMVMVPLLLGIDIDYGILTVSAWVAARSRRQLLASFRANMTAVVTCAAATVIGFGSLIVTSIPAVRSLGCLIIVGVLSCLLATVLCSGPC